MTDMINEVDGLIL